MGYTKKGPFTNGAGPGIDKAFLDGVEDGLVAVMNGKGLLSARPAAGNSGARYFATDEGVEYRDNGTTWDKIGSDADTLDGYDSDRSAGTTPAVYTVGVRDAAADLTARLFRSTYSASSTPGSINYMLGMNAIGSGADNYMRPLTLAQVATVLGYARVTVGSYTGDGVEFRTISIGITPTFVIIHTGANASLWLASSAGTTWQTVNSGNMRTGDTVVAGGFEVTTHNASNQSGQVYRYCALY